MAAGRFNAPCIRADCAWSLSLQSLLVQARLLLLVVASAGANRMCGMNLFAPDASTLIDASKEASRPQFDRVARAPPRTATYQFLGSIRQSARSAFRDVHARAVDCTGTVGSDLFQKA